MHPTVELHISSHADAKLFVPKNRGAVLRRLPYVGTLLGIRQLWLGVLTEMVGYFGIGRVREPLGGPLGDPLGGPLGILLGDSLGGPLSCSRVIPLRSPLSSPVAFTVILEHNTIRDKVPQRLPFFYTVHTFFLIVQNA